jgi:hypothetical protein
VLGSWNWLTALGVVAARLRFRNERRAGGERTRVWVLTADPPSGTTALSRSRSDTVPRAIGDRRTGHARELDERDRVVVPAQREMLFAGRDRVEVHDAQHGELRANVHRGRECASWASTAAGSITTVGQRGQKQPKSPPIRSESVSWRPRLVPIRYAW